jgi:hypothetical protein
MVAFAMKLFAMPNMHLPHHPHATSAMITYASAIKHI